MFLLASSMKWVFLSLACQVVTAQLQDPYGKVIIGNDENDTTDIYSFNANYLNQFSIPVTVVLVNGTTGEVLPDPPSNSINVSCETTPHQSGYTKATFMSTMIDQSDLIDFIDPEPGRAIDLRCWGEDPPVFTKDLSLSEPVIFQVRPPGKVSITQPVVLVPNQRDSVSGSFIVELSEEAETESVIVTCRNSTALMQLTFEEAMIPPGERKASIVYEVKKKGQNVNVYCLAQSNTSLDQQFQFATSQGEGAQFILAEGSAILVPERSQLKTTEINVTLIIDSTPTTDVIFACYLHMAKDSEHASEIAQNPICEMPTNPTPVPGNDNTTEIIDFSTVAMSTFNPSTHFPTTPDDTIPWSIKNNIVSFQTNSDLHQSLMINRKQDVNIPTAELFVVTCCAPNSDNDSPKYVNVNASLVVASYLTPSKPINWTNATEVGDSEKETDLINPAFVEVSPCSCNLYEDACDINCCCDQDCTAADVVLFTCIPGLFGGNSSAPPSYMCNAPYIEKPDWFSLMCVQWNNSAFLGYFIHVQPIIRDISSYRTMAEQYGSPYSFRKSSAKLPLESNYKDGSGVRTGLPMNDKEEENYYIGSNYRLTLPKRTLGGVCALNSPVQFLRESSDECEWKMKEDLCTMYSPLSALVYVQADQWVGAKGPLVLSSLGVSTIADTTVNYLCADTLAGHVQSTDSYEDLVLPNKTYLFDYEIPAEDQCTFDVDSGAYVCLNQTSNDMKAIAVPPRCPFDDGFTKPPAPVYDKTTNVCTNVVLSVLYNFTWQGTKIVHLNATITLGNVSTTTKGLESIRGNNDTVLTQTFDVLFYHKMSNVTVNYTDGANENYLRINRTDQYKRSGNPGYEWTKPVISGIPVFDKNDTFVSEIFSYMDTNATSRLSLWKPGVDGLCQNAGRQDIQFGVETLGTCILKLGFTELQDCLNLRRLILNRQDSLMLSTFISIGGDPDYNTLDIDWAPVFRQNISHILEQSGETTTDTPITSTSSPITVPPGQSPMDMLNKVSGLCTNIPSHIIADIMYAKVGERDAVPIWQIVGAKISYILTTWRLFCVGSNGMACYTNTTWIQDITNGQDAKQPFQLYSSVRFIKVPYTDPEPKTLYQERTEPRIWKCKQDACIEEVFYPFLKINPGDSYQYTTSLGLICLIFLIGLFLISRPISRWDYIHGEL